MLLVSCSPNNETNVEGSKKLIDFFIENKIEVFEYKENLSMENFDEQFEKVIKYLERNGPIDSYERLLDEDEIIPLKEEDLIFNEEEKLLNEEFEHSHDISIKNNDENIHEDNHSKLNLSKKHIKDEEEKKEKVSKEISKNNSIKNEEIENNEEEKNENES